MLNNESRMEKAISTSTDKSSRFSLDQVNTNQTVEVDTVSPKTHFNVLTAIGVQFSVTAAPLAIGSYLSLSIGLGGSPAYFWGFIMVGFFQTFVCLAVAELASAMPHSSGTYMLRT